MDEAALAAVPNFEVLLVDEWKSDVEPIKCAICANVMFRPVETLCSHWFCSECLMQYLQVCSECPRCRSDVNKDICTRFVKECNQAAYRMIFEPLQVKCPLYSKSGCPWTGGYSSMSDHINNSCQVHPAACRHCRVSYARNLVQQHEASCMKRPSLCPHCEESVASDDSLATHINTICSRYPIKCEFEKDSKDSKLPSGDWNGCGGLVARDRLGDHQRDDCPKRIVSCEYVGYGCSYRGCFDSMDEHVVKTCAHHLQLVMEDYRKAKWQLTHQLACTQAELAYIRESPQMFVFRRDRMAAARVTPFCVTLLTPQLSSGLKEDLITCAIRDGDYIYMSISNRQLFKNQNKRYHVLTDSWSDISTGSNSGHLLLLFKNPDRILQIGTKSQDSSSAEILDLANSTSQQLKLPGWSNSDHIKIIGTVHENKAYLFGQWKCEVIEIDSKSSLTIRPIAAAPFGRFHDCVCAVVIQDRIWILRNAGTPYTYDPATNKWEELQISVPRDIQAAVYHRASQTLLTLCDSCDPRLWIRRIPWAESSEWQNWPVDLSLLRDMYRDSCYC